MCPGATGARWSHGAMSATAAPPLLTTAGGAGVTSAAHSHHFHPVVQGWGHSAGDGDTV